jgi:hypothetical protein
MEKIWKTRKAGKLANGWERGKGKPVHAVISEDEPDYFNKAVCGLNPKISWTILDDTAEVTCPQCLKKLKSRSDTN